MPLRLRTKVSNSTICSRTIDDGKLYFTVRFMDQTSFCVRYACDMFAVGVELSDWQSGDFHIIREYMKPIPR